jgi:lambda repressor-like predicted transcriptional regulator
MTTLRIKEILQTKGLTLQELSQLIDVSENYIQSILDKPIQITEETATVLNKISEALKIPLVNLFTTATKQEAVRLRILDLIQEREMSLEELSDQSGVHPSIIAIYSTQPICKQKLVETKFQENLVKISQALTSNLEDLQVEADLPITRLRFREMMELKGLTVDDLSTLTGLPNEFVELVTTEPMDMNIFRNHPVLAGWSGVLCRFCPVCCKPADPPIDTVPPDLR